MSNKPNVEHLIGRKLVPYFTPDTLTENTAHTLHDDGRDFNVQQLHARRFVDGVFVDDVTQQQMPLQQYTSSHSNKQQSAPNSERKSRKQRTPAHANQPTQHITPQSTPHKQHSNAASASKQQQQKPMSAATQYAAPKFSASPAPDTIPMPKFLSGIKPPSALTTTTTTSANTGISANTSLLSAPQAAPQPSIDQLSADLFAILKRPTTATQPAPAVPQEPSLHHQSSSLSGTSNASSYAPQPQIYTQHHTSQPTMQQTPQHLVHAADVIPESSGLLLFRPKAAGVSMPQQQFAPQQYGSSTPQRPSMPIAAQYQSPPVPKNPYQPPPPTQANHNPSTYAPPAAQPSPYAVTSPYASTTASTLSTPYAYRSYTNLYSTPSTATTQATASAYSFDYSA